MNKHLGFVAVLIVIVGAICHGNSPLGPPLFSQDVKKPWEIFISYGPSAPPKKRDTIALRPNVAQPVFLYLKNTDSFVKSNLQVKLVRLDEQKKEWLGRIDKIGGTQLEKIKFNLSPVAAKDEAAAKEKPVLFPDKNPPFHYQVWVKEGETPWLTMPLEVTIQHPQDYTVALPSFDKKSQRLLVGVEVSADAATPPCPVELVLDPRLMPGLVREGLGGNFKFPLNAKQRDIVLRGENIQFAQGLSPKNGRVALTIDGYERAYLFESGFDQGTLRSLSSDKPRVRVKAAHYFNNKGKDGKDAPKLELLFEADGDSRNRLEWAYDPEGSGNYIVQDVLPSLREQGMDLSVRQDGSLLFKTLVQDWKRALDTVETAGKMRIRLCVLDPADNRLELADEQDPTGADSSYAPLSYDRAGKKSMFAEIVLDPTPPQAVEFKNLPTNASPGQKLLLKAKAKERYKEQAPFKDVVFFVDDPKKENPFKAELSGNLAQAYVLVPADAKGKVAVTVQFNTFADVSASKTETIGLQAGGNVVKFKIVGTVIWNDRKQPGKLVKLQDDKGKEISTTKTAMDGTYQFLNVAPGIYYLEASEGSRYRGTNSAVVAKDGDEVVRSDITLKFMP